jgi:hypothetical protein
MLQRRLAAISFMWSTLFLVVDNILNGACKKGRQKDDAKPIF